MDKQNSKSTEDFIFTMLQIYEKGESNIRLVDIASDLQISRAATSKMSSKLAWLGLIEKPKYSKIKLTKKGKKFALETARKHRIVEVFLHKKLGLKGKELEEQAHKLEHALNPKTLGKLSKFLGKPEICPHGKTIYPRS